jgi:hypothetical protein
MDWLLQNLISNWIWAVIMASVGAIFAWLKHKDVRWLPVLSYGLGGCALAAVIIYTLTGRAILSTVQPQTTSENVENNIKKWADSLGLGTARMPPQSLPIGDVYFSYVVTLQSGNPLWVFRAKEK